MCGLITFGQAHPFLLVGYFGVPPICRGGFLRDSNSISAKRMCFQCLRKIKGFISIGTLLALSVIGVGPRKRPASYMNNSLNPAEIRIWL
jgi:hypothetical protein